MRDGTTKNGRYFGTTVVPSKADQDKFLFFPAAGNRYYSNGMIKVATNGFYWSSTASSGSTARRLSLGQGGLDMNYNDDRFIGFSIRCVRDK